MDRRIEGLEDQRPRFCLRMEGGRILGIAASFPCSVVWPYFSVFL